MCCARAGKGIVFVTCVPILKFLIMKSQINAKINDDDDDVVIITKVLRKV